MVITNQREMAGARGKQGWAGIVRALVVLLATAGAAFGFSKTGNVYTLTIEGGDDYLQDFKDARDNASAGDIIDIHAGDFTWTTTISLPSDKHLIVRGQGGGGIVSYSETVYDLTAATPNNNVVFTIYEPHHTFPVDSSTGAGSFVREPEFTIGETLIFRFTPRGFDDVASKGSGSSYREGSYFTATVDSYTYPTLTVDVSSAVAGGYNNGSSVFFQDETEDKWQITRPAMTTITQGVQIGGNAEWFNVNNATTGNHIIRDIRWNGYPTGASGAEIMELNNLGGEPTIVKDCWFNLTGNGLAIAGSTNKGIVTGCTFTCNWDRDAISSNKKAFVTKIKGLGLDTIWVEPSTMGKGDLDGETHLYIEDCVFSGFGPAVFDAEGNSKNVTRYNRFLWSTVMGGHGQDSGQEASLRHYEVYKCIILTRNDFEGPNTERTITINDYISPRGGTFVAYSNYFTNNEQPSDVTNKGQIAPAVRSIREVAGFYPCWGNDNAQDTVFPAVPDTRTDRVPNGEGWPAPRQPGMGYVDGMFGQDGTGGYTGDPEPIWVWGNSGYALEISGSTITNECGATADSIAAYFSMDRDDDNTWGVYEAGAWIGPPVSLIERSVSGKPEYAPYTYPHPLAPAEIGSRPVVAISSPSHPATASLGASVTLSGTSTDAEDGTISSAIAWRSSIDGTIGTGASVMTSVLTAGHHIIYAKSTDADGQFVEEAIALEVAGEAGPGAAPVVTITAPADDSIYESGSDVTLTVTATDAEDGDIAANVTWTSSLDGSLGTGASVMTSQLNDGQHVITATVTDSDANEDADAITLTMGVVRPRISVGTLRVGGP